MATKQAKLKEITITLRINEDMEKLIKESTDILNKTKPLGSNEVTKTEAIRSLIVMGHHYLSKKKAS